MTALRILNLIAWLWVFAHMAPALWSILRGQARLGDPVRLVCAAFAFLVIGFNARWLLIPESQAVQAALYAISAVVAGFTSWTARSYGRGDHV